VKNLLTYTILIIVFASAGCGNSSIKGYWLEEGTEEAIFLFEDSKYSSYFLGLGHLEPEKYNIEGDSLMLEIEPNWKITWVDNDNFILEKGNVSSKLKRIKKWKAEIFLNVWENTMEYSEEEIDVIPINEKK
jgi:hypothetical protein